MANYVYEIDVEKPCPRCASTKAKVAVYYFGSTHVPCCSKCGLGPDSKQCDHKDLAVPMLAKCYYEYEEEQKLKQEGIYIKQAPLQERA
jgi:hypothetical protein